MKGKPNSPLAFILATLLVVVAGGSWFLLSEDGDEGTIDETETHTSPVSVTDGSEAEVSSLISNNDINPPPVERDAVTPLTNGKAATVFSGHAVDTATGKPVTDFTLSLRLIKKSDGGLVQPIPPWHNASIASSHGRFAIHLETGGKYIIRYKASGYQRPDNREIEIQDNEEFSGYILELTPGLIMTGRVVDGVTNKPLAGSEVVPFIIRGIQKLPGVNLVKTRGDGEPVWADNEGCFTVSGLREGMHRLWARHPDYSESFADGEAGNGAVEIQLYTGSRLYGLVRNAEGKAAQGVDVNFYSRAISTMRTVQTGADGQYTTPPLPAGSYTLSVYSGKEDRIMSEMQSAELFDRDLEVNFGPRPGQVVWRGALIDGQGNAVVGAKLTLRPQYIHPERRTDIRTAQCTADTNKLGSFEVGPLDLGKYNVDVQFAENTLMSAYYTVGQIEFDQPGLILRDLYLPRTEISGVVIDGSTGEPLRNSRGFVMACERWGKILTTSLDSEGRFCFQNIPPGTYNIVANSLNTAQGRLENIVLEEGGLINDLRIELPSSGKLTIRVTGLEEIRGKSLSIKRENIEGDQGWTISNNGDGCSIDQEGVCTVTIACETGSWKVVVTHIAIGRAEKVFTIKADISTEVEIDRSEFLSR